MQKKELSVLTSDLNDIFESCYNYMRILSELAAAAEDLSKETLIEKLIDFYHIHWHYKSLKKELKKIYNSSDK